MRNDPHRRHAEGARETLGVPLLYNLGRYGQKTGAGWFRYGEDRKAAPDPEVAALVQAEAHKRGIEQRAMQHGGTEQPVGPDAEREVERPHRRAEAARVPRKGRRQVMQVECMILRAHPFVRIVRLEGRAREQPAIGQRLHGELDPVAAGGPAHIAVAARAQHVERTGKCLLEDPELVVHHDAQRLEHPAGGVATREQRRCG